MSKDLYARLDDYINLSSRKSEVYTDFLDDFNVVKATNYLKDITYRISTIPNNAKKRIISFNCNPDDLIVCVKAEYNQAYANITYSDVFGTLMSMRIKKEVLGDIYIANNYIYIYTFKHIANDIIINLTSIKNIKVDFKLTTDYYSKEQEYETINMTIASNRLDAIVGGIINTSRDNAKQIIMNQDIKVNQVICSKHTKIININDVLSVRGYGRYIYDGIIKNTRKQRIVVQFRKYK